MPLGWLPVVLGFSVAALWVYLRTRPATICLARSVTINAPPERVFALLEDFHNWPQWAPQDRRDARLLRSYSGAPKGIGAQSDWTSRGSGGSGSMRITRALPSTFLEVQVDFTKPFAAHNVNAFTLQPRAGTTVVTWSMQGTNAPLLRLMGIFVSPERLLGGHFEQGLANLGAAAEHPRTAADLPA